MVETPDEYGYYINDNLKCTWKKEFYNPDGMVPSALVNERWNNVWEHKARGHGYTQMEGKYLPATLIPEEPKPVDLKPKKPKAA